MCTLIRNPISESLVKIEYFRHECSSIMYENTLKRNKIKRPSITCSYIWHKDTPKCVYWFDTHSVKVCWIYVIPNKNDIHFCDIFFRHRAMIFELMLLERVACQNIHSTNNQIKSWDFKNFNHFHNSNLKYYKIRILSSFSHIIHFHSAMFYERVY